MVVISKLFHDASSIDIEFENLNLTDSQGATAQNESTVTLENIFPKMWQISKLQHQIKVIKARSGLVYEYDESSDKYSFYEKVYAVAAKLLEVIDTVRKRAQLEQIIENVCLFQMGSSKEKKEVEMDERDNNDYWLDCQEHHVSSSKIAILAENKYNSDESQENLYDEYDLEELEIDNKGL